jgi:hypothetical protein
MKASRFIETVETKYDVAFVFERGHMHVLGKEKLPPYLRLTCAAHRERLTAYLERKADAELAPTRMRHELEALGLLQLENGEWTHPEGDAVMDEIVSGLLDPDAVKADAKDRSQAALEETFHLTGQRPPMPDAVTPVVTKLPDGSFTWTEEAGVRITKPFSKIERIP